MSTSTASATANAATVGGHDTFEHNGILMPRVHTPAQERETEWHPDIPAGVEVEIYSGPDLYWAWMSWCAAGGVFGAYGAEIGSKLLLGHDPAGEGHTLASLCKRVDEIIDLYMWREWTPAGPDAHPTDPNGASFGCGRSRALITHDPETGVYRVTATGPSEPDGAVVDSFGRVVQEAVAGAEASVYRRARAGADRLPPGGVKPRW